MSANPAYAALFNPGSAAGQAVSRLRETAILLAAEGMRGKDLTLDEWVTIVDIDRVLPETPPPGRMAPLLRAAGRVASRSAEILARALAGKPLTTGEWHSLDTAAAFAQSACRLTRARARSSLAVPPIDMSAWLTMLQTARAALPEAMESQLDPDDVAAIEQADDDIQAIAAYLDNPPDPEFKPLFSAVDAMRWSRWLYQVHADIHLTRREFLSTADTLNWGQDSRITPIALDSDGRAVVGITFADPSLYADTWDVDALAERLAAGVEVML